MLKKPTRFVSSDPWMD